MNEAKMPELKEPYNPIPHEKHRCVECGEVWWTGELRHRIWSVDEKGKPIQPRSLGDWLTQCFALLVFLVEDGAPFIAMGLIVFVLWCIYMLIES